MPASGVERMKPSLHTICFEPIGRRVSCDGSQTLLEAAQQAGVEILALCGGFGGCGRCRVVVEGEGLAPASELEQELFSGRELAAGYRLACRTPAAEGLTVYVPETSRPRPQRLQTGGYETPVVCDPGVVKHYVHLPPPTLEDTRSDLARLGDELLVQCATPLEGVDLEVLSRVGSELREAGWRATLALRGPELIDIEGGDTTGRAHGIAIDLGSTKLAIYLVDLARGGTVEARGVVNPQIAYGEDIIGRLQYAEARAGGARHLQEMVVGAINDAIQCLCDGHGLESGDILEMTVVGNTAMHHLFLGLPTGQLARSPHVPVLDHPVEVKARALGLQAAAGAYVYCLSPVAGFVGSDHVAMVLASRLHEKQGTLLGIDIGTNTEISLARDGEIQAVSCASGPAFEGAVLTWGMKAAPGAIERVWVDRHSQAVQVSTIGGEPPLGFCGSGILDSVAGMLGAGILDGRGRIRKEARGVRRGRDGLPELVLAETASGQAITIGHHDVERIQLAKGAIRSGIEVLMDAAGVTAREIDGVVLAGAFGSYIDSLSAIQIGMLPAIDPIKFSQVGNAAGVGAKEILISKGQRRKAEELADTIRYLELTVYPGYSRHFALAMRF